MGRQAPPNTGAHHDKKQDNNSSEDKKPCRSRSSSVCFGRYPASQKAFTMVDAFCATWKLVDSENFDEYMKALGKRRQVPSC